MHARCFGRKFIRQYLFHERRPTFIHTHGPWSRGTGMESIPELATDYHELRTPGPRGSSGPPGCQPFPVRNFIRRDAFAPPQPIGGNGPSRVLNGIVELRSQHVVDGEPLACVLTWRLLRPLGRGEEYAWVIGRSGRGPDEHTPRQSLLYGLVKSEDIEPGRWHREYVALPASPTGERDISLVFSSVRNVLEPPRLSRLIERRVTFPGRVCQ